MSAFTSYEKMPLNLKKLPPILIPLLDKVDWVVTEKVHGANFSFIYEQQQLSFAKRKALLSWEDDFFGFQLVAAKLEGQVISLFEALSMAIPAKKYTIYDELFGGAYPHPSIPINKEVQAIQTGVYYSPDIQYYAFDISIEDTDGQRYYLDYAAAIDYFEKAGIFYAKPLFTGRLNKALDYNASFQSTIPALLDLALIDDNWAEGIVIKPLHNIMDSNDPDYKRPILKIKHPLFEETATFHQAEQWSFVPNITLKGQALDIIIEQLYTYVTPNRLDSVLSKIGALDFNNPERMNQIRNDYIEDVFIDFNEEHNNLLELLENDDIQWLSQRITAAINQLLTT